MKPLVLDDAGEIETPETGCVIQSLFVFSSGRELLTTTKKTVLAAQLIERLLDIESEKIESLLKDLI